MAVKELKKSSWAWTWVQAFFIVVAVIFFRVLFLNYFWVPSGSMKPNIDEGQMIFAQMNAYGYRYPFTDHFFAMKKSPKAGEVVISFDPRTEVRIVKRVVAVPGETVEVKKGHVYINGRPLFNPSTPDFETYPARSRVLINVKDGTGPDFGPIRVPDDHYLLMGDNRGHSLDGRFFGFVPSKSIHGRVLKH